MMSTGEYIDPDKRKPRMCGRCGNTYPPTTEFFRIRKRNGKNTIHFGGRCAVCERPPGLWHTIAADHWTPISSPDCPGTVPSNIVPLCHGVDGCNNSKHDRDAAEWLSETRGKRQANKIIARIEGYFESIRGAE